MENRIKAVLVGCGGMSGYWLPILKSRSDVEIVGLVDLDEELPKKRKEEFELTSAVCGTDLDKVLDESEAKVVFDLTIPAAHYQVAMTAFKHGCHLLQEKPLALCLDNAREMISTAKDGKLVYAIIQNRRYDANIRRFSSFIQSGALGELEGLHSDFFTVLPDNSPFRNQMKHVLLEDMAIHTFDAARVINQQRAVKVACQDWNPKGSWFAGGAATQALFEMADGSIYTYRGSWMSRGANTSWEASWRAQLTEGGATWDGGGGFSAQKFNGMENGCPVLEELEVPEVDPGIKKDGHAGCIEDFMQCVKNGGQPENHAADNFHSIAMALCAIESAENGGKTIKIPTL